MAQNSYYDNDIKHVLIALGSSSGNLPKKDVKARLVQYGPKVMRSMIAVMAAQDARAKALRNSGGY